MNTSANEPEFSSIILDFVSQGQMRTGRHFSRGGAEKIGLKITIWPESNFFSLIRMGPETSCKSVLYSCIRLQRIRL